MRTMQKTMNVDGQKLTVRVRRRHSRGNPCGFWAYIGKSRFFFNVLNPQEAMDKAVAKYRSQQASAGADPAEHDLAKRIAKHPMYSPCDLAYFRRKGYSDAEILAFWDRDHALGHKPCHHQSPPDLVGMLSVHPEDHGDNAAVNAALERIAREHLGIETLETRKSDGLDFHEVSVWQLKAALDAAFALGHRAARHAGIK